MSSPPSSSSIGPKTFYQTAKPSSLIEKYVKSVSLPVFDVEFPRCLRSIVDGPSETWKVFKKQNDALNFSKKHGGGLMTFAFQQSDGGRLFLSADPVFFWFYDNNPKCKQPCDRRTYEIITEGAPCKLYFDLEFDRHFNLKHNGVNMTNTFMNVVSFFLKQEFALECTRRDVMNLDSTNETKFSRHLIYQMKDTYFRDNYNVGNFVKMICERIRLMQNLTVEFQEFCSKCCVTEEDMKELFVLDKKGHSKLFCDEGVYTKNRHFRLFKSTKLNKNSPLTVSEDNEFKSRLSPKDKNIPELQFFLDSLISFCGLSFTNQVKIVQFGALETKSYTVKNVADLPDCPVVSESGVNSPEPVIDRFIMKFVQPGYIRRSTYFSSINRIVYDIAGNRFCRNIGRAHKSNNIIYIVDLEKRCFYQKCHDPDCSGFRSMDEQLPPEVEFLLDNESDMCLGNTSSLSDEELLQVWEAIQVAASVTEGAEEVPASKEESSCFTSFPEFGLSDSEIDTTLDAMEGAGDL